LAQFEKLDNLISKRRRVNQRYKELLPAMSGISFQNDSKESESNFWLTAILVDEKVTGFTNNTLRVQFLKNEIETRFP